MRVCDLLDESMLRRKLAVEVDSKNAVFSKVYGAEEIDFDSLYNNLLEWSVSIRDLITPTEVLVQDALQAGQNILVECAQGSMLDIDYGTYPYVTSSSPTAAGACQGAGVAPTQVERVLGVYKAYSTRVGAGPMPTELHDDVGEEIRQRGNEFGTTTGRPRRTGWFDGVAARQTGRLNGVTEVALTLVDVLDTFDTVKVSTGYDVGGKQVTHVPAQLDDLAGVAPVWQEIPGWNQDTTGMRTFEELPSGAREYISVIEQQIGAAGKYVGVGPARDKLIPR